MPLLANLLLLLGSAFANLLTAIFAFRLAFALAYLGLFTAGAIGLYNTMLMLAESLAPVAPPQLTAMVSWVIPANLMLCISALVSAQIAGLAFVFLDHVHKTILGKA